MAHFQSLLILLCAAGISPWCLARRATRRADLTTSLVIAGVAGMLFNVFVPVLLHVLQIPITTNTLCGTHVTFAALLILANAPFTRLRPPAPSHEERLLLMACGVFALLIIPITPLAGIDTYKWQGLATNMSVEQCVPWLVHPLSLLGFTPRAYPSAQPLMLATVQQGPLLGLETGFFVISIFTGLLGMCAAFRLARLVAFSPQSAVWVAILYGFSPIFMRYTHWATGRGFFLAVYPAFLAACLARPRWSTLGAILSTGLLLPLTHKTGLVALGILPLLLVSRCVLPRSANKPILLLILAAPACLAALLLSPPVGASFPLGCVLGFLIKSMTRFGWYIPALALSLVLSKTWFSSPRRALILPLLVTLPLAYPADMYGAMLSLPFIVLATGAGVEALLERMPRHQTSILRLALALTLTAAISVIAHRSLTATPRPVRAAARFLDSIDPQGPFQVQAPGRTRVQVHAYVRGCPRFVIDPPTDWSFTIRRPPSLTGAPAEVARDWVDFLRNLFEVPELGIDWYGRNPRQYYFRVNGAGDIPADTQWLYDKDGIEIHAPVDQHIGSDDTP